jgi:hypothetical protein
LPSEQPWYAVASHAREIAARELIPGPLNYPLAAAGPLRCSAHKNPGPAALPANITDSLAGVRSNIFTLRALRWKKKSA